MPETIKSIASEIKHIAEITSRMDERVKIVTQTQNDINDRLDELISGQREQIEQIREDIADVDDCIQRIKAKFNERLVELEDHKKLWGSRVNFFFSYVWQGTYIICICYLLFKMGINNPPIP